MQDFYCNKCGKKFDLYENWFHINNNIGYGSKYDGDILDINLCNDCMDEIIDSCVITPTKPPTYRGIDDSATTCNDI